MGTGAVWTGAEDLVPTKIRPPDRPARTGSLYRMSYPGRQYLLRICTVRNVQSDAFGLLLWIYTFN